MNSVLGRSDGGNVSIDLDALVKTRALLTANSGAGKSWAIRRILEQTHGKIQHFVIDLEGEFFTLRERFDYVLAGKGGDTAAEPRSAALLARRLLELHASAVLDLYELNPRDRILFVKNFVTALVDAPKDLWHPVLVVVDEAHHFAPEDGSAESSDAIAALMSRGRKRGYAGVLATQRLSKLSKDVAAEANNLVIGRCGLDVDIKRAAKNLGMNDKDAFERLRALKPGTFFVYGPALSDRIVEVKIGDVQTSHPQAGTMQAKAPAPRAKVLSVLSKLADLPKEAEAEARTTLELQAKVRALEAEARNRPVVEVPKVEIKEVSVLTEEDRRLFEKLRTDVDTYRVTVEGLRGDLDREIIPAIDEIGARVKAVQPHRAALAPQFPRASTPTTGSRTPAAKAPAAGSSSGLGKCERAILSVLANYPDGCEAGKLTLLSGYSWTGSFRTALSALRTPGFILGDNGGVMKISEAGFEALGDFDALPQPGPDLQAYWIGRKIGGLCGTTILKALIEAYPGGLTADDLVTRTGYEWTGSFRTALSSVRTAGLLVGKNGGEMKASETLFP